jgi:hypothetical protein
MPNATVAAIHEQLGFSIGQDLNIYPSSYSYLDYASFPTYSCQSSPQSNSTLSPLDIPYPVGDYFDMVSPMLPMTAPIKLELYNHDYQKEDAFGTKQELIAVVHDNKNTIDTVSNKTKSNLSKEAPKKIHICEYCHRSFARKYDVARHKRIHTGNKPYACPCCPKSFARSDARVRHFRTEIACRDGADKLRRK